VIGLLSGQKQPALLLLVGFAVALLIQRGRPSILSWRLAVAALAILFVIAPVLFLVQYPTLDYSVALQSTLYRLTGEPSRVAQLRFIFYPDIHPYQNGLSSYILRSFASLLGIDTSSAASPETYIPASSPGILPTNTTSWNAGFFADAWADFGFVGVAAASFMVGFLVRAIDRWYAASGKGAVEMGVYTAVCISAFYMSEVGTLTALWTYGLGSAFLLYWLLRLLSPKRKPVDKFVALNKRAPIRVAFAQKPPAG
jgi:oligosaccharide repeat unit polymerase